MFRWHKSLETVCLGGAGSKGRVGMLKKYLQDESGATAVEYGIIAALISITLVAGATLMGGSLNSKFESVSTEVGSAGTTFLNE